MVHDLAPLFSLFDDSLAQLDHHMRSAQRQFKRPFNPKFDVKETKEAYSVEGELPGFDAKDINIEFLDDGHTLQIKGKTVQENKREHTPAKAVESSSEQATKAVEAAPASENVAEKTEATTSETSSLRSHQATVEDDVEEPANASAVEAATQPAAEQPVVEASKEVEQPRTTESEPEAKNWVSERYTGSFTRSFKFPSKVDQVAVKASLKDGILAITLPFARKPESRKIQIE